MEERNQGEEHRAELTRVLALRGGGISLICLILQFQIKELITINLHLLCSCRTVKPAEISKMTRPAFKELIKYLGKK